MNNKINLLERKQKIVELMIYMYCKNHHRRKEDLCNECEELRNYAMTRLDKCRYGNSKPKCRECKTHCYSPIMKEKIIKVMRFSGPRMIFYHPIYTFYYMIRKIKTSKRIKRNLER